MNGYPIQPAKVQRPPLRDETLARDRLLDWLRRQDPQRVILVLADAGYGKTTLLADFSRRTRLRTLWYRLDDDDRDWISFLSHLVAAGREHDPEFAPATAAMLSDLAMGGPTREAATDVFLRELPTIAEHGAVLILDDFHLVDESPDIRHIARELVARARSGCQSCSRAAAAADPARPAARLGEVAEIGTDDLRFDAAETARLFTETYGREPRARRPRRRRRADRRLGGLAAARPGGAPRPLAGRDPSVRPEPDRRRPGAVRLPRGGGRRRPARGPPAVPDADLDPPGRHPGARRGRHGLTPMTSPA